MLSTTKKALSFTLLATACSLALGTIGCSGEDDDGASGNGHDDRDLGPAYIVGSTHNTPDGWNAYVAVLPNLAEQEIDYTQALEVAGRADVWATDGKVFVGDADSPTVTRYGVSADLALEQEDRPLSFSSTGLMGGCRAHDLGERPSTSLRRPLPAAAGRRSPGSAALAAPLPSCAS